MPRKCPSQQVFLTHVDACPAEPMAKATKDLVPCGELQGSFEGDIRHWTLAGLKQFDMDRLISDRVKPLQLGERGRQKVRYWRDGLCEGVCISGCGFGCL